MQTKDFHCTEYECLRAEQKFAMQQRNNYLVYSAIANATIFLFIVTNREDMPAVYTLVASLVPTLVTIMFFILYLRSNNAIHRYSLYFEKLEARFGEEGLGWETQWSTMPRARMIRTRTIFILMFITQILFGIVFAVLEQIL